MRIRPRKKNELVRLILRVVHGHTHISTLDPILHEKVINADAEMIYRR